MTRLTASFPLTAGAADIATRTITGTAVPYDATGSTSWGPTVVKAGAVTIPDRVPMLMGHNEDRPIGLMSAHIDSETGLTASFKIAGTGAGDEALLEAEAGIRNGLSVGLAVDEYALDTATGVTTITAARLIEVSLVTFPAFDTARVLDVAATHTEPEPAPQPNPVEESPVAESTATPVVEAAAVAVVPRMHVQDPFPYRPGVKASYFADMLAAGRGDHVAAERQRIAAEMLTAAQVMSDVSEIIPEIYRPDLYQAQLPAPRIVIDSFSKGSITGPDSFRIPKWGTSSGLIDDHVEGVNPTDGTISFGEQLVTPKAMSGQYTASREMIEGSTPAVDAIIMNAIREAYAVDTEAYAITELLAGATAGTVVDISDGVTMQVRARMVTFQANRGQAPNVFLAGSALFSALTSQIDGSGRPFNPEMGAVNSVGSVASRVLSVNVSGLQTPYVPVLTGGVLGAFNDFTTWESGLRMWRYEEVDGPANIRFAAFGYIVAAVTRASGVLKFATQA
jgi:HK97 family phage prohead protease